jgi:hypothetical protein
MSEVDMFGSSVGDSTGAGAGASEGNVTDSTSFVGAGAGSASVGNVTDSTSFEDVGSSVGAETAPSRVDVVGAGELVPDSRTSVVGAGALT